MSETINASNARAWWVNEDGSVPLRVLRYRLHGEDQRWMSVPAFSGVCYVMPDRIDVPHEPHGGGLEPWQVVIGDLLMFPLAIALASVVWTVYLLVRS